MAGGDQFFTCKDCHKSGPYGQTPKRLDPRPHVGTRVVCQDCALKYKAEMARKQELSRPDYQVSRNYRKPGVSQQAAEAADVSARLSDLHEHIFQYIRSNPSTPGEVFKALSPTLGKKLNTYRARITDLKNTGRIEDSGDRRANDLETVATVWRAVA